MKRRNLLVVSIAALALALAAGERSKGEDHRTSRSVGGGPFVFLDDDRIAVVGSSQGHFEDQKSEVRVVDLRTGAESPPQVVCGDLTDAVAIHLHVPFVPVYEKGSLNFRLVSLETGETVSAVCSLPDIHLSIVGGDAISASGRWIAQTTVDAPAHVTVYDARTGAVLTTCALSDRGVHGESLFSRDEERLHVVSDGKWLTFELPSGKKLSEVASPALRDIRKRGLAASGELVTGSGDETLALSSSGETRLLAKNAVPVDVSRSGDRVVVIEFATKTFAVVDVKTAAVVWREPRPAEAETPVAPAISPSGRRVGVTITGKDGLDRVEVWDLPR